MARLVNTSTPDCLCGKPMFLIFKKKPYDAWECHRCLRIVIQNTYTLHQKWFRPEDSIKD